MNQIGRISEKEHTGRQYIAQITGKYVTSQPEPQPLTSHREMIRVRSTRMVGYNWWAGVCSLDTKQTRATSSYRSYVGRLL
jgi:hypothetical protein